MIAPNFTARAFPKIGIVTLSLLLSLFMQSMPIYLQAQTLETFKEKSELWVDTAADYQAAEDYFRQAIADNPKNSANYYAQYQLARIKYRQKLYEEAINELDKVINLYPDSDKAPTAYWLKGYAYHYDKIRSCSIKSFEQFIEKYPEHEMVADALERLGHLEILMGNHDKALARFEELLNRYPNIPNRPTIQVRIARLYQVKEHLTTALDKMQNVISSSQSTEEEKAQAQLEIAGLYFEIACDEDKTFRVQSEEERLSLLERCREEARKVLQYNPSRTIQATARLITMETYYWMPDLEKAIQLGQRIRENFPDQKRECYVATYFIARSYRKKKTKEGYQQAISYFEEILAQDIPKEQMFGQFNVWVKAAYMAAKCADDLGDVQSARKFRQMAFKRYPTSDEGLAAMMELKKEIFTERFQ